MTEQLETRCAGKVKAMRNPLTEDSDCRECDEDKSKPCYIRYDPYVNVKCGENYER